MFRLFKQLGEGSKRNLVQAADASAKTAKPLDRRKISGERVSCHCEFTLSNPSPFMHAKIHVRGRIVLNVRGCCVYPNDKLALEDSQDIIAESQLVKIKKMVLTGTDGQTFQLSNLEIRRVRLMQDEHGKGIILRFVNLSEEQLDLLVSISDRYAMPKTLE